MKTLKEYLLEGLLDTHLEKNFDKGIGDFTLKIISILSKYKYDRAKCAFTSGEEHEVTMDLQDIVSDLIADKRTKVSKDKANDARAKQEPVTVVKIITHSRTGVVDHLYMVNPHERVDINFYTAKHGLIVTHETNADLIAWPQTHLSMRGFKEFFFILPKQDLNSIIQMCK